MITSTPSSGIKSAAIGRILHLNLAILFTYLNNGFMQLLKTLVTCSILLSKN